MIHTAKCPSVLLPQWFKISRLLKYSSPTEQQEKHDLSQSTYLMQLCFFFCETAIYKNTSQFKSYLSSCLWTSLSTFWFSHWPYLSTCTTPNKNRRWQWEGQNSFIFQSVILETYFEISSATDTLCYTSKLKLNTLHLCMHCKQS